MKKVKLSFLMMAFFVLLLAACSGGKETAGTNEKPANDKETEKVEEVKEEEATYDLGGRVIKIVDHYDRVPLVGTEFGDIRQQLLEEAEKKYNVKIEYVVVPFDEKVNQFTTTVLAGEPFADIIGFSATQAGPLIQQDLVYALDDVIDLSESKMTQGMKDLGKFNDKAYMLKFQVNESGGMYYNKTMFEQAGLEDPYVLQEKGEWTWEAMLDAAKKLTNGKNYGLSADPSIISEYSIFSNDAQYLDTNTGEIVLDSPNSIEALEFVASLYNEHKVIKPNEGNDWEDPRRYFTEGLVGMTQGWIWEAYDREEAPFEWGYVMWPKGPKASDNVVPLSDVSGDFIPKGVEDPQIVYKIWEDLQIWDGWEDDVVDWFESVLPNEESINTATTMLEKIKPNYWKVYNLDDAFYETFSNIASGAESPTQAITKVKGEAQARVDEFLDKK
ncbi:ABC transporter substrate-binding protein [Lederbergia citrea]|uniref:ABC transporter substrate-binding protein n=1 Tax=Lederbergia citrea TaxID=2833581 RepID=UPI001BCA013A|nr:extracellular solute-binding protein [Lederbergia citrea]MBS4178999.1 extracellular solute-binding protein [Lederbergia citrea]